MAKNNNLTDFLTDVADAIRAKKGTSALINPQNFSDEIASIQSGGDITQENISIYKFQDLSHSNMKGGEVATDIEYEQAEILLQTTYESLLYGD